MDSIQKTQYGLLVHYYLVRSPIESALKQKESSVPLWRRIITQQVKIVLQFLDDYCELTDQEKQIINSQIIELGFPSLEEMIDEDAEMEAAA